MEAALAGLPCCGGWGTIAGVMALFFAFCGDSLGTWIEAQADKIKAEAEAIRRKAKEALGG